MKHHVIYVPGLGDYRPYHQDLAIKFWRIYGLIPHYHAVIWREGDSFKPKLDKLLVEIDTYLNAGDKVSLISFSAGASAVLNAFAARKDKINAVVCISGKINHPENVSQHTNAENPAFKESLELLQKNLRTFSNADRQHLLTIYPFRDQTVHHEDAVIEGVQEKRIPAWSHLTSVAYSLTIGAFGMTHFLKNQPSR
ncbi:MAG TPA: hypothetical protein VLG37_02660 [Candidatus Saccharimonadales bacterium]|nr:hypothetical protein [Candidatus Saccharimonadales bacterium]